MGIQRTPNPFSASLQLRWLTKSGDVGYFWLTAVFRVLDQTYLGTPSLPDEMLHLVFLLLRAFGVVWEGVVLFVCLFFCFFVFWGWGYKLSLQTPILFAWNVTNVMGWVLSKTKRSGCIFSGLSEIPYLDNCFKKWIFDQSY